MKVRNFTVLSQLLDTNKIRVGDNEYWTCACTYIAKVFLPVFRLLNLSILSPLTLSRALTSLTTMLLLPSCKILVSTLSWFKSFSTEREQRVRNEKSTSSWRKINGGLPQRTKLGPLLFAVYCKEGWNTTGREGWNSWTTPLHSKLSLVVLQVCFPW